MKRIKHKIYINKHTKNGKSEFIKIRRERGKVEEGEHTTVITEFRKQ
jgi:hypothetical protein